MSNTQINLDDLVTVVNVLRGINGTEKSEEKSAEQAAQREAEAQAKAKEAAEQARKAEEEAAKHEAEANETKEEINESEAQKQAERENRYISKSLETHFEKAGISGDVVSSISGFINYDKLKNDDNEADEEKISSFAEVFSSVANRKPPKGTGKRQAIDDDGGIAKYLPNNN